MIFRAYALENPGVWGWPQGALSHHDSENGYRKFTIFAILHLLTIKTVAGTCRATIKLLLGDKGHVPPV